MKLWLVRHAQPLAERGLCYGSSDVPADPQATLATARALATVLPRGLRLVSSPLQRCEQLTLATTGLRPDLTVQRQPLLAEMDFGEWEGQPWDRLPLDAWMADFRTYRPGHGESVQTFMARVSTVFDETLLQGQATAWITHAGVIRATHLIRSGIRAVEQAAQWPADAIAFGSWRVIEI